MSYQIVSGKKTKCLECGTPIQYGRSDKKFCCDYCKNRWHNERNKDYVRIRSKVTHALDKNYRILTLLLGNGKTSAPMSDLQQWGFSPEYVTGMNKGRMRTEYRCFDIRYNRSENKIYNICRVPDSPSVV